MNSQDIVNHIFGNKEILSDLLKKMRSPDMETKHDAIDFFMEVCQMSKNMQFGQRSNIFDTITSVNLIEILAETLNIYYPDSDTLKCDALQDSEGLTQYLLKTNKEGKDQSIEKVKSLIEDFQRAHDKYDIKKLDFLKINSIEILM